jgi:hypothetical protein
MRYNAIVGVSVLLEKEKEEDETCLHVSWEIGPETVMLSTRSALKRILN